MIFELPEPSRAFMALAGKALRGGLTPEEENQFDQLMKEHPEFKHQFTNLSVEVEESKLNEIWERGLRVLLKCPQPEDGPFLASVEKSDPKRWSEFIEGAFVLRVMAESMKSPSKPTFNNTLTAEEEKELLDAVNKSHAKQKGQGGRPAKG
jgi:hypothetical protein